MTSRSRSEKSPADRNSPIPMTERVASRLAARRYSPLSGRNSSWYRYVRWSSRRARSDYTSESGRVTFKPGDTKEFVRVETYEDKRVEPNEYWKVLVKHLTNATVI